jgi:Transposase
MHHRRLVGIDLGIISAHTVRVLDSDGGVVCRRKAVPTADSLLEVERAALAGAAPGTCLEVVLEPTGPSWLPIAVCFTRRGHTVYRVSSAKAHDLRRVLSRQAKSNGIDADTLARLPLVDPAGLHPLGLPSAERAALDRRVRACDRLTQQGAEHKRRIKDLVRQLLPTSRWSASWAWPTWPCWNALAPTPRAAGRRPLAACPADRQGLGRASRPTARHPLACRRPRVPGAGRRPPRRGVL